MYNHGRLSPKRVEKHRNNINSQGRSIEDKNKLKRQTLYQIYEDFVSLFHECNGFVSSRQKGTSILTYSWFFSYFRQDRATICIIFTHKV